MAFTTSDLETLETAILALSSGAEEVAIGSRKYRKSSLPQLRDTYDWMQGKVNAATTAGISRLKFNKTTDQDQVSAR